LLESRHKNPIKGRIETETEVKGIGKRSVCLDRDRAEVSVLRLRRSRRGKTEVSVLRLSK